MPGSNERDPADDEFVLDAAPDEPQESPSQRLRTERRHSEGRREEDHRSRPHQVTVNALPVSDPLAGGVEGLWERRLTKLSGVIIVFGAFGYMFNDMRDTMRANAMDARARDASRDTRDAERDTQFQAMIRQQDERNLSALKQSREELIEDRKHNREDRESSMKHADRAVEMISAEMRKTTEKLDTLIDLTRIQAKPAKATPTKPASAAPAKDDSGLAPHPREAAG